VQDVDTTRNKRPLWPVALPLAVFGAVVGFLAYMLLDDRDPSAIPSALVGRAAPSVAGPSLIPDAPAVTDAVFGNGEPVLVNFFASWCVPCRAEHPVLTSLARDAGLTIVGVNYKDGNGAGLRFLEELGNPYSQVAVDADGMISLDWGVTALPETFIVDGDGIVVYRHAGPVVPDQRDDLLALVEGAS
jgi:cytochrome c biogenesis protein CcmG/thiol:disulfide interchange protein DsbE